MTDTLLNKKKAADERYSGITAMGKVYEALLL